MFKVAARSSGRNTERYFLRESTLSAAERTGEWGGSLAEKLELPQGPITSEAFLRALADQVPDGPALGRPLHHRPYRKEPRTVAYDCIIAPHKSFSLLALYGPPPLRAALGALFRRVVRRVPAILERLTPNRSVPRTQHLLTATFVHTHSRRNDPHLHAHVVIPCFAVDSVTLRPHRLDPRFLFQYVRDVTRIVQRLFLAGLRSLGLDSRPRVVRSVAAAAVPRVPIRAHSRGAQAIDALAASHPRPTDVGELAWRNSLNFKHRPRKSEEPVPVAPPSRPALLRAARRSRLLPVHYPTKQLPVYRPLMKV